MTEEKLADLSLPELRDYTRKYFELVRLIEIIDEHWTEIMTEPQPPSDFEDLVGLAHAMEEASDEDNG